MLDDWPLGRKLGAAFGLIVVLMLITAVVANIAMQRVADHNHQAMETMDQAMLVVQREVDHLNWTNQLADSFLAQTRFPGQLDFTRCAFGQWFYAFLDSDSYREASDEFRAAFDAMEDPHTELHETAVDIVELQREGVYQAAEEIYHERTLSILGELRGQLNQFQQILEAERASLVEQARSQERLAQWIIGGSTIFAVFAAVALAIILTRYVLVRPLATMTSVMTRLNEGDLDATVAEAYRRRGDEIGDIGKALESFKVEAVVGLRASNGLEEVSTGVMIADNDGRVVYANRALKEVFAPVEQALRRHVDNFSVQRMQGVEVAALHPDPQSQKARLEGLRETQSEEIELVSRIFRVTATPVFGKQGDRQGTALEWIDRTQEIADEKQRQAAQEQIETLIEGIAAGQLDSRMDTDGLEGFLENLGQGVNQVIFQLVAFHHLSQMKQGFTLVNQR